MYRKIALGVLTLAGIGIIGGNLYASAYQGDAGKNGPNYSPERHEKIVSAINNNDYNAWKELMGNRGRVSQMINEQNFPRFAEMKRLMWEGKNDEADKIREELGLNMKNGNCGCKGNGQRNGQIN
ncbi:MAG TPA: hypothetical protein PLK35_04130 [Candidatus Moranbacteria bacterium]|nr:hypothetical protein [Candidatus Moranbacteria bacterium]